MTEPQTVESSARRILGIFREQGLAAGHFLQSNSFVAPFSKPGWTLDDLEAGLGYAIEEDWIEQVSQHAYRLTAAGFAQA